MLTDIDECASSPCRHQGNCTDLIAGYKCSCPEGTTDLHCETGNSVTLNILTMTFY